jgi:hypothetical protein
MQENDQDTSVANEEVVETEVGTEVDTTETTDAEESPQALKARLQRAEKKIEKMKLDAKVEKKVEKIVEKTNTGELDETSLLWLEVKGIKTDDPDELKLVEDWRKDSGKDVRAIHASKIFQSELKALRDEKELKDATPSNTKRSGGSGGTDVATALAKYEATGTLPDDFKLRTAVVNAKIAKDNTNKPAWH